LKASADKQKEAGKENLGSLLKAHSDTVELKAVERVIKVAAKLEKLQLHICHVSTKKALDTIKQAKKTNANLTCEATPHHLLLTLDDYARLGNWALTMPPLRTKDDVSALWRGIAEATVDTVGSDHAPHTREEKDAANIWDTKAGVPGLETTLPLMLTLVHKRKLTLGRTIELLSEKPAAIYHLSDRGRLEQGRKADFVVVDFNAKFKIDASKFKSNAKLSPFDKVDVQGRPVKTFVSGQLIMEEGEVVARAGCGSIVRGHSP
jgi:dihydroorotase (multifunctional complex type)